MAESGEKNVARKSGIVYAAVFAIISAILGFLFIGWVLDRWLGTSPWLLVTGIILGSIAGFYQFIRLMSRVS